MIRLDFFLTPAQLFWAIADADLESGSQLILRRFSSSGFDACFTIVERSKSDDNAALYIRGGYSQIYLSLGAVPANQHDWDFPSHAANQLLLCEGGRTRSKVLELAELRIFAKTSDAKNNFQQLTSKILSICTGKSITTSTGVYYDNIYFDPTVANDFELRLSLDNESPAFHCKAHL